MYISIQGEVDDGSLCILCPALEDKGKRHKCICLITHMHMYIQTTIIHFTLNKYIHVNKP